MRALRGCPSQRTPASVAAVVALRGGYRGPPVHETLLAEAQKTTELPETRAGADTRLGSTDALLLLMTVIWGANFTAIKYSIEDLLPLSFNGLRFAIASVVVLVAAFATGHNLKVAKGDGWRLFGLGLFANTFYQSVFIIGMAHTRAGNAALILATTPMITAIIGRLLKQEYFTPRGVFGLVLAFAGILLIILTGHKDVSLRAAVLGCSGRCTRWGLSG